MGKLTSKEIKQNIFPFSKASKGQKLDSNLGQISKINRLNCGRGRETHPGERMTVEGISGPDQRRAFASVVKWGTLRDCSARLQTPSMKTIN